jgi:hypothetical protein
VLDQGVLLAQLQRVQQRGGSSGFPISADHWKPPKRLLRDCSKQIPFLPMGKSVSTGIAF